MKSFGNSSTGIGTDFTYIKALVVVHNHIYVLSKGVDRKLHVLIKMSVHKPS